MVMPPTTYVHTILHIAIHNHNHYLIQKEKTFQNCTYEVTAVGDIEIYLLPQDKEGK